MYILNENTEITQELIEKLIQRKLKDNARLDKLQKYYENKGKIMWKTTAEDKPNNIIGNPYGKYVVDTLSSLFSKITYNSNNEAINIKEIMDYNDAEYTDNILYRNLGLFGRCVECHWIDDEGECRFNSVDPRNVILCIRNDLRKDTLMCAIHIIQNYNYLNDKITYTIEVYDDKNVKTYDGGSNAQSLLFIGEHPHYYNMVPWSFAHQDFGDFEKIVSLIDAYDQLLSSQLDDFDMFVDSYLLLTGLHATSEEIQEMKHNRVILLDDSDSKAEWLIKSENDTVSQNLLKNLQQNIHKFSFVPDFTDQKFGTAESGISLRYKIFGTEAVLNNKEKAMALLLRRRIELICQILRLKGIDVDFNAIGFEQHRNLPENLSEVIENAVKLSNIVSTETLLSTIPIVKDVDEEMVKLDNEMIKRKDETPFII